MRTWRRATLLAAALVAASLAVMVPATRSSVGARRVRADGTVQVLHRFVVEPSSGTGAGPRIVEQERVIPSGTAPAPHQNARATSSAPQPTATNREPSLGPATDVVVHAERAGDGQASTAQAPSSGKCPKATTCDVFNLMSTRWKTDATGKLVLRWRYNDAGRRGLRAPPGMLENALKADMAEWHRWNSNINFVYDGTTTTLFGDKGPDGSCDDGTNTIGWAKLDPGVIAETLTCTDKSGRRTVDADLALNITFHWEDIEGQPKSRHSFDIRSIVMHELGHVLSLDHPDPNAGIYQTMMGNSVYGETRKRTPALGDILGLQKAYPCGSGDACPRTGIADD